MLIAVTVLAVSAQSITDNSTADGDNSGTWDNDTDDNNTYITPVKNPPEILLKSRHFVPEPGINQTFAAELLASEEAAVHVLIQLYHAPTDAERKLFKKNNVNLLAYIPDNAWFASIPPEDIARIAGLQEVRWVGKILPEDKMAPSVREKDFTNVTLNLDGTVNLSVMFFSDVPRNKARKAISNYGGLVTKSSPLINVLKITIPIESISDLADDDSMMWINQFYPGRDDNDGSRAAIGVNTLQTAPYNLDGTDVQIGQWEGGLVNTTHPDLIGRVTINDTEGSIGDHATHVAGIMIGNGTLSESAGGYPQQWRGVATNATVVSYEAWLDDWIIDLVELYDEYDDAINNHGIDISQNSWSTYAGASYDEGAQAYDNITRGALGRPITIVGSAGNEGELGLGWWTVNANNAKNIITVGETYSNDDSIHSESSRGPTNDGRIKPDVVAPGSQRYGDGGITSTGHSAAKYPYFVDGGTSMAAPAVSGSVALMLQDYRATHSGSEPLPSTVKAILLHTAKDINNTGPDYTSGYGRIDAFAAVSVIEADNDPQQRIVEDEINTSQIDTYNISVPAGIFELKFTLVWDDFPATPNANKTLVNNLDLVVTAPNGTEYFPWILDPNNPGEPATKGTENITDRTNNVEQVVINSPAGGTYNITVNGTNVSKPPQTYSLILPDVILPAVTITSPSDTINDTTPDLNFTVDEPANTIYSWDAEGNITGCRMCTSFNVTYGEAAPDANTSLLFHFNENHSNRVYDDSGTGNDGMIYGTTWTAGRFGNALEFYGKKYHYVRVPDSAALALNDSFTLSAWINSKNSTAQQGIIYKIVTGPWVGYHLNLLDGDNSMKLQCMVHDNASTTDVISDSSLTPNEWYYVACVRDKSAGKVYLYVNGMRVGNATDNTINKSILNNNSLNIGTNFNGYLNFFNGTIDEVAIYNRSLSAEEIQEQYNKSLSDDGAHNVTVYAKDTAGNMNSSTAWFILNKYTISLNEGWNLISIPLNQTNWSITAVLASIDGNYTAVYAWIDGAWKWTTALFNPLTEMDLEHGYWINMTAPDTLELTGTVPASTTINVSTGWNLVGYPSITTQSLTDVLSSINYTAVYAWIDDAWKWSTALFNPLTEMSPGYGYWINATGDGSYEVTTGHDGSSSTAGAESGSSEVNQKSGGDAGTSASTAGSLPPAIPTELYLNLLNLNGSNINTSLLLTIDYLDSNSNPLSINSVDNPDIILWRIYNGKSNLYAGVSAKDGTNITVNVEGYESLTVTAVEGGYISGDYNLTLDTIPPKITITSPQNTTISDTTPDLNLTTDEMASMTYAWNSEGNISGCTRCTSYSTTYGESVLDANTSILFHFNEYTGNTIYDDSSNNNNGTIYAATWTAGRFGNALDFDGNDYVNVPDDDSLDFGTDSFTIMAWIKTGSVKGFITNKLENWNGRGSHTWINKNGKFVGMIHDTGTDFGIAGTTLLNDSLWHHVAFVVNWSAFPAGTAYIYVDGVKEKSKSITEISETLENDVPVVIGSDLPMSTDYNFTGTIDDVHIIKRALNTTEILDYSNRTLKDGQHNVTVYAKDVSDNWNSTTRWFTVAAP